MKLHYLIISKLCLAFKVRFIEMESIRGIGHLSMEPACYVMQKKLGEMPYRAIYFFSCRVALKGSLNNQSLLKYWRKYFLFYLFENSTSFIEKLKFKFFEPIVYPSKFSLKEKYALVINPKHYMLRIDNSNLMYELKNRYPHAILKISNTHKKKGYDILSKLGMPKNAWFVTFHARDHAYYKRVSSPFMNDFETNNYKYRIVDVNSYYLALKEIVERGGWCIRLGDKSVAPLDEKLLSLGQVIDYATSPYQSDEMDIFLLGENRFLLGCNSGPAFVPTNFGKPVVQVQVAPAVGLIPSSQDIVIIRRYYSDKEKRLLNIHEMLSSPLKDIMYDPGFEALQVKVLDNSQEEIKEAVVEMMDRLDNKIEYTEQDKLNQIKIKNCYPSTAYCYNFASNFGRDFLNKNLNSLLEEASPANISINN